MKKGIFLSTALIVGALTFGGCNVFQSFDKASGDQSVSTKKYEANEALNSGDYQKAYDKSTEIVLEKYSSVSSYDAYKNLPVEQQSEFVNLQTIRAESSLGKAGVNALDIVSKLQDVANNSGVTPSKRGTSVDDSVSRLTDIVTSIDPVSVANAVLIYETFLAPDATYLTPSQKENLKSTYQTAGIAVALDTALKIIAVFDVNGDGTINKNDSLKLTAGGAVDSTDEDKLKGINSRWQRDKSTIINGLLTTVNYLEIALGTDIGKDAVSTINETKDTLNKKDDVTAAEFNDIINNTLAGK